MEKTIAILELKNEVALGGAWGGNTVNCVPFRVQSVVTDAGHRYVSYYSDDADVVVCRLNSDGTEVERFSFSPQFKPYDAHKAISIGIDTATNILHLAYGAHGNKINTCVFDAANLAQGYSAQGEYFAAATYPMFLNLHNGKVALIFREGTSTAGAIRYALFNQDLQEWEQCEPPLISGAGGQRSVGPYLNTPVIDNAGRVHLFYVWRLLEDATDGGAVVNMGMDYAYSDDFLASLRTSSGLKLAMPVTPSNTDRVVAVPLGHNLINQSSSGFFSDGRPCAVSYWNDSQAIPQYRLMWLDQGEWRTEIVSDFETGFSLGGYRTLPLPHSRPEVVVDNNNRVILLFRSMENGGSICARILLPPKYDLQSSVLQILHEGDLGHYEPIIDRCAWYQKQELTLYIQRCEFSDDRSNAQVSHPASIKTWKLNASAGEVNKG